MPQKLPLLGRHLSSGEWGVLAFTAAYLLATVVQLLRSFDAEFLFYLGVMCVLIPLVLVLHARIRLPILLLWGLSIWGLAHMAGGLLTLPDGWPTAGDRPVLYNLWLLPGALKFDQLVHAYGFALVTWTAWHAIAQMFERRGVAISPTPGLLIVCALGGMGAGALNEVVEFAAVQLLPDTNVGGYQNTGWDLVANMVGSVLAAFMIGWLVPKIKVDE